MKIYIAGPMTGVPYGNRQAFNEAAISIRNQGDIAINPCEIDYAFGGGECFEDSKCLELSDIEPRVLDSFARLNLEAIRLCDAICLLPGWEGSKGSMFEVATAIRYDLKLFWFSRVDLVYWPISIRLVPQYERHHQDE